MSQKVTTHRSQIPRSGMALGGIGTGWFEIRQDGGFRHWRIFNNWPLFTGYPFPFKEKQVLFFLLRVRVGRGNPRLVILQLEDSHSTAGIEGHEFQYMFPWLTGVDTIHYEASCPFADLTFEQEGLPLKVSMRAWSPFIPGNVDDSALPLAFFDFEISSTSHQPVEVELIASARNCVGYNQPDRCYANDRIADGDFSAVVMRGAHLDADGFDTGTMCLASFSADSTAYRGWAHHHPYYERLLREGLVEFDDTEGRNSTKDESLGRNKADEACFSSIGHRAELKERGASLRHRFALSWHFPNLYGNLIKEDSKKRYPGEMGPMEGHAYAERFESAAAVARYGEREHDRLLRESVAFHCAFFDSDLPGCVLDQVNSQLNTFRTSTWLTPTGVYGVLEGLAPHKPFAGLATTDVAMYGQIATSLLFPELDRMTVDLWCKFQQDNGIVIHSAKGNSREVPSWEKSGKRLDMPGQFAFMALRCALWSGDRDYLQKVWPHVKAALAYVLRERDMDGDSLPDMEGVMCSYDNFPMFGVSPFVASQWLAAVAAALKVAESLDDRGFMAEYEAHFQRGRARLVEATWTGDYFRLYSDERDDDPEGRNGCLVDQVIGEGAARQLDLPPIIDREKRDRAFDTILAMNYRPDQGLRNCQWPGDDFLHPVPETTWIDQANTCWTGVELNFAAHLYHAGRHEEAENLVRNVDERHRKWGIYWDHQEFGGHYFRPMAALGIPNAFLGMSYDGKTLKFAPARPLRTGRWCFLLPGGYGTLGKTAGAVHLELHAGEPSVREIIFCGQSKLSLAGFPGEWASADSESGYRLMRKDG